MEKLVEYIKYCIYLFGMENELNEGEKKTSSVNIKLRLCLSCRKYNFGIY